MSAAEILEHFRRLPSHEQEELVELLSNELIPELSVDEIAELERRADELRQHPERGIPLETVRAEMGERLRRRRQ